MPAIESDTITPGPSIVPDDVAGMTDDECLVGLAQAVEAADGQYLDEVTRLIARLAVPIE